MLNYKPRSRSLHHILLTRGFRRAWKVMLAEWEMGFSMCKDAATEWQDLITATDIEPGPFAARRHASYVYGNMISEPGYHRHEEDCDRNYMEERRAQQKQFEDFLRRMRNAMKGV